MPHLGLSIIRGIITNHRPELPVFLPHDLWKESQDLKQEFNLGSLNLLETTYQCVAGVKVRLHFFRERVHNLHQILKYSVSLQKIKNHFLRRKALKQKLVEVSGR